MTAPDLDPDHWSRRFDLLGDPTRLRLLMHMHMHPHSTVNQLARAAGITQTAASQALRVLREQGWVTGTRDGRTMRYRLIDEVIHQVLHFIGQSHQAGHAHGATALD